MKQRDNAKFRAKMSQLAMKDRGLLKRILSPWKKNRLYSEMIIYLIHDLCVLEKKVEALERKL